MANVSSPAACHTCGRPLPTQHGRGRQRRYCDATCRSAARRQRATGASAEVGDGPATPRPRKGVLDGTWEVALNPVAEVSDAARDLVAAWTRATTAADPDPLVAMTATRKLAAAVDDALQAAVDHARANGRTWQEIGDRLGTSRQAAFQRFGRPNDPATGRPVPRNLLPGAADQAIALLVDLMAGRDIDVARVFDEMAVKAMGETGLAGAAAQVATMVGAYEGMGEPTVRTLGLLTIVDVPMRFEAGELVGRVTYRQDGRVTGLFFRPPTP